MVLLSVMGAGFFLFKKPTQKDLEFFELIKEEGYFIPLKIYGYSHANMPFLDVKVGEMTIPAIIDLGFQGMFSLPVNLIKKIDKKKWIEHDQSYGLKGRIYENNVYEIEDIKIEDMSFPSVKILEGCKEIMDEGILLGTPSQEYCFGFIGWKLFAEYNLLVDCRQYIVALCDSLKTLKQQGYPIDVFTETPLLSDSFLIIEAITEKGPVRCLLDTGSTWNMLNKDWENGYSDDQISKDQSSENEDSFIFNDEDTKEFSNFEIEGKEFGPITFSRIKSPLPFDVILGMDFFDSHLVFIDFEDKKVYIAPYPKGMWPKPNLRPTVGRFRFHNL